MSLPSLYIKGKLKETGYGDKQSVLDTFVPLDYVMNWFASRLDKNDGPWDRILVVKASTGSGKSTVFPPEFYSRFFKLLGRRNICCTQPRVLTAKEIPRDVVRYNKPGQEPLELGKNIGYQTGKFKRKPQRGIVYMQIGVLPAQMNVLTTEEFMSKYSVIFLDEVHVRQTSTDLTMYKMKKFIAENYKNKKCPFLVLMSATFNPKRFADYFLSGIEPDLRYKNIIEIEGLSFPIEEHFLASDTQNFIHNAIETIREIMKGSKTVVKEDAAASKFRDILIFVPGAREIELFKKELDRLNSVDDAFAGAPILAIGVTSITIGEAGKDYENIFKPHDELLVEVRSGSGMKIKKPSRRVFIATNVAETGITIPTLGYVIDLGFYNSMEFNPNYGVRILAQKPVTQGMYKQRRGRVGRKAPGTCYAMFTKESFAAMAEDEDPDIIREDISRDILDIIISQSDVQNQMSGDLKKLIATDFFDPTKKIDLLSIDLMDKPSADSLQFAVNKLFTLGAITPSITPTLIGVIQSKFRLIGQESIKFLAAGYVWGAPIMDIINIIAFQEVRRDDILNSKTQQLVSNEQRLLFADDMLEMLIVWNDFTRTAKNFDVDSIDKWCTTNEVDPKIMVAAAENRDEIMKTLASLGLNPLENYGKSLKNLHDRDELLGYAKIMKQCIFEGYSANIAELDSTGVWYISMMSHIKFVVTRKWTAKYIIYDSILYKRSPKKKIEPMVNLVCALDGFVSLDTTFDVVD
jgi:HrpA-like RNA helicase